MPRVAVGGTFNPLHDGHIALLKKAVKLCRGGELLIGLTSNEMTRKKDHEVEDYSSRLNDVIKCIKTLGIIPTIVRLDDPYGPTIREDFDSIVVSPETQPIGLKINTIRKERGLCPLKIVLVDYVLADDGLPISSTRIWNGEIDKHGKVLTMNNISRLHPPETDNPNHDHHCSKNHQNKSIHEE